MHTLDNKCDNFPTDRSRPFPFGKHAFVHQKRIFMEEILLSTNVQYFDKIFKLYWIVSEINAHTAQYVY